jgi:hypothetical protein
LLPKAASDDSIHVLRAHIDEPSPNLKSEDWRNSTAHLPILPPEREGLQTLEQMSLESITCDHDYHSSSGATLTERFHTNNSGFDAMTHPQP